MRLSTVFELLLIFLFLAFAASRHIEKKHDVKKNSLKQSSPNRYCSCTSLMCNCCRDFTLPVVSLKGPGCATVAYLNGDAMRLTMTFGDRVLRNVTLAGRRPRPVCMSLPGGVSKFCGRIYGIERDGENHFKACLALELRAVDEVEAALRISCFKFGPQGIKLEPSKPIPSSNNKDEDDEDDDDDYGLDDEDDDDDYGLDDDEDDSAENDVDSGDYTGFSALSDEFLEGFFGGESSSNKKKKPVQNTVPAPVTRPTVHRQTTTAPTTTRKTITTEATSPTPKVITTTTVRATTMAVIPEEEMKPTDKTEAVTEMVKDGEEEDEDFEQSGEEEEEEEAEEETEEEQTATVASHPTSAEKHPNENGSIEKDSNEKDSNENDSNEKDSTEKDSTEKDSNEKDSGEEKDASEQSDEDDEEEEDEEDKERERALERFPGLAELIRKPSASRYQFPPSRSARTHRRMRI